MKILQPWLLIVLALFAGCATDMRVARPPVTAPFAIGKAGATASVKVRVTEKLGYVAQLRYVYSEHDPADRAKMWKLANSDHKQLPDGRWFGPGAPPLLIKVAFRRVDGDSAGLILEKTIENPQLNSWGATTLNAPLAGMLLEPGVYEISAESLRDAPSFEGARTILSLDFARRPK